MLSNYLPFVSVFMWDKFLIYRWGTVCIQALCFEFTVTFFFLGFFIGEFPKFRSVSLSSRTWSVSSESNVLDAVWGLWNYCNWVGKFLRVSLFPHIFDFPFLLSVPHFSAHLCSLSRFWGPVLFPAVRGDGGVVSRLRIRTENLDLIMLQIFTYPLVLSSTFSTFRGALCHQFKSPLIVIWGTKGWLFIGVYSLCTSIQFSRSVSDSVIPWTEALWGLPVHHQLLEFTQTHVHWVGDAIQPSNPLPSPSPPTLNLSHHQGLFKWVSSSHQVAKVLEFWLQHQSFQWIFRTDFC